MVIHIGSPAHNRCLERCPSLLKRFNLGLLTHLTPDSGETHFVKAIDEGDDHDTIRTTFMESDTGLEKESISKEGTLVSTCLGQESTRFRR